MRCRIEALDRRTTPREYLLGVGRAGRRGRGAAISFRAELSAHHSSIHMRYYYAHVQQQQYARRDTYRPVRVQYVLLLLLRLRLRVRPERAFDALIMSSSDDAARAEARGGSRRGAGAPWQH